MEIIEYLFNLAKKQDRIARCRTIAAIIKRNKIFAIGKNSYKGGALSHRFKKDKFSVFEHAEVSAIKNFLKKYPTREINKYDIIILRAKLNNEGWILGCSKPCRGCQKAIQYFQLRQTIFYWRKRWWALKQIQ